MRAVLVASLLLATACGKGSPDGDPGSNGSQDTTRRDQARFDAERRPDKVVEALGIKPGSRVADVGANKGLLTLHLARAVKPGGVVVATEIDGQVLDLLQARLVEAGLGDVVETRVVSPELPGLEPDAYDAILLAEVDHLLCTRPPCSGDDVARWLAAAMRALKPTGRLVINNKLQFRASSVANAQKAGLVLHSESVPVPSHFIATFVRPAKK